MQTILFESPLGVISYRLIGEGKRKIIFFHGFPGSSAQIKLFERFLQKYDLQVLCFDRPGYNQTHIKSSGDNMADAMKIAMALVDKLSWQKFEVFGVSGGAPYALSLSGLHSDRVLNTQIMCGLGALNVDGVSEHFSKISKLSLHAIPLVPGKILKNIFKPLNPKPSGKKKVHPLHYFMPLAKADIEVCLEPGVRGDLDLALKEALVQNALGPQLDSKVFLSSWSKNLSNLKGPICFWHGAEDKVINQKVSLGMSATVPGAKFVLIPNHGHLSLPIVELERFLLV